MMKTYYIITKGEKYERVIGNIKKLKMPDGSKIEVGIALCEYKGVRWFILTDIRSGLELTNGLTARAAVANFTWDRKERYLKKIRHPEYIRLAEQLERFKRGETE